MEKLRLLWLKYKQPLLYLIFGGLTTLVNLLCYWLCTRLFSFNYGLANVVAWIVAVLFAFVTNKFFVFESKSKKTETLLWELGTFFGGRLLTLGAETLLLWVGIDLLHWNDMLVKLISNIVVILLNFVISKLLVFRKKGTDRF